MKLPSVFLTECKIGGLLKRRKNDLLKDYQDSKPLFWMALLFGPMAKTFVSPHIAPFSFGRMEHFKANLFCHKKPGPLPQSGI
jgi:hypothetical protein